MRDARAEVTRRVDRIPGGATERGADADHEQGDRKRRERAEPAGDADLHVAVVGEGEDHEDEHEGRDDLGDEVPAVGADRGAGREDTQLVAGVGLVVEVLLVRDPADDGADERADHLSGDGDEELRAGDLAGDEEAERDRRVQLRARVGRDEHTREHREAPAPVDHEGAAAEALRLGEDDVGDDAAAEEDEHGRPHEFGQEVQSEIDVLHVDIDLSAGCAGDAAARGMVA